MVNPVAKQARPSSPKLSPFQNGRRRIGRIIQDPCPTRPSPHRKAIRQKRIKFSLNHHQLGSSHHNPTHDRAVDDYKFPVDFTERGPALSESRVFGAFVSNRHWPPQPPFGQSVRPNHTRENMCSTQAWSSDSIICTWKEPWDTKKGQPHWLTLL